MASHYLTMASHYAILASVQKDDTRKPEPMTNLRKDNDQQQEAQRFAAQQASREQSQLDPRSVLLVVEAKLAAGLVDEARAIVAQWKAGQL